MCVCACMCVASFPFSPHTGRQQQPRCHALCLSACSCCFCSFIVNLWLPLCCARTHSLLLPTQYIGGPCVSEWVSEWCVCIALNSLLLLQWERARELPSSREWVFICLRVCVCVCNNKGNFAKVQMPPHCDSAFYYYYTHFIEKKYTQKASVAVTVAADADATL